MTALSTEEMQRLHRLVSGEMPPALSPAAAAGEACVWCGGPIGKDATHLEASVARMACAQCYITRIDWYSTWYDWQHHVSTCVHCQQAHGCPVGRGFRALHDATITPAGKGAPECVSCHHPVHTGELAVPVQFEGQSSFHLGYGHSPCMLSGGTSR